MEQETNILDKIYNVAKAKRLVLNQDEFAQLIGTSRGSLHRYRNGDAIPEELIINAKHVLNRVNYPFAKDKWASGFTDLCFWKEV